MKWDLVMLIVLMVALVALFAVQYIRKNKYNAGLNELRKDLKSGDKVMTDSGLVGTIVDSYEEEGYRYIVLKSGKDEHFGYFTVPANAIYYVYGKDIQSTAQSETKANKESKDKEEKTEKKD